MVGTNDAASVICLNGRWRQSTPRKGPGEAFSGLNAPTGMASTTSSKSSPWRSVHLASLLIAPIGFKVELLQSVAVLDLLPPGTYPASVPACRIGVRRERRVIVSRL